MSAIYFKTNCGIASSTLAQTAQDLTAKTKTSNRLSWVDCAKGLCIILVVMLHSTRHVTEAVDREGLIQYLVAFAKPFRMPDFFMISGLFLARVINRDWITYLDRKVVHFFYFYILWVTINFLLKSPAMVSDHGATNTFYLYLQAFIQPLGTLWFIYILPIFFVVTKLVKKIPPILIFFIAAALQIATIETGSIVIDQAAERFVYFFTGYWMATRIFSLAAWVQSNRRLALLALTGWAIVNGTFVFAGFSELPFISLMLGFIGAAAIVTIAALLSTIKLSEPIRYCGQNSIIIYLSFFLTMNTSQLILLKTGILPYVSVMALISTAAGIIGPLMLWWVVRKTKLSFLFKRPIQFYLQKTKLQDQPMQISM